MKKDEIQIETLRSAIDVLVRVLKITDRLEIPETGLRLNPPDTQALLHIAESPDCIASEISQLLGVAPTTTTTIVDRLVKNDLVIRKRTESNRRVVLLSLTAKGERTAEHVLEEQRKHCAIMLDALPAASRKSFVSYMKTIADAIE